MHLNWPSNWGIQKTKSLIACGYKKTYNYLDNVLQKGGCTNAIITLTTITTKASQK